jgi:universal stress protein A
MISAAAGEEETMAIKRILVPIDFSDDSLNALAYARDFARPFGAELILLYVVEPIYYATPADLYVTTPNVAFLMDEQRRIGKQQLARLGADMEKKHERFRGVVKVGSPSQSILDTSKSAHADMVIMSTHGRTGFAHMLLGSVAEKVVRGATCPVLTVRRTAVSRAKASKHPSPKRRKKTTTN